MSIHHNFGRERRAEADRTEILLLTTLTMRGDDHCAAEILGQLGGSPRYCGSCERARHLRLNDRSAKVVSYLDGKERRADTIDVILSHIHLPVRL